MRWSKLRYSSSVSYSITSLRNPSKDHQRSVDAFVLIFATDWSNRLSNFEIVTETQFEPAFERRTFLSFAKLLLSCWTMIIWILKWYLIPHLSLLYKVYDKNEREITSACCSFYFTISFQSEYIMFLSTEGELRSRNICSDVQGDMDQTPRGSCALNIRTDISRMNWDRYSVVYCVNVLPSPYICVRLTSLKVSFLPLKNSYTFQNSQSYTLETLNQVIPSHGSPQRSGHRLAVIYSNTVPLNTNVFTKYLRRHPSKHIRTKKPRGRLSKCLQEP